jgi:hypothetical protein
LKQGGSAIPYHEEDPAVRANFRAALAREGVADRMPASLYDGTDEDDIGNFI